MCCVLALLAFQRTMHFAAFRKPIAFSLHRGGSPAQDQHIKRYLCINCESAATHLRSISFPYGQQTSERIEAAYYNVLGHARIGCRPNPAAMDGGAMAGLKRVAYGVYIFARIGCRSNPATMDGGTLASTSSPGLGTGQLLLMRRWACVR